MTHKYVGIVGILILWLLAGVPTSAAASRSWMPPNLTAHDLAYLPHATGAFVRSDEPLVFPDQGSAWAAGDVRVLGWSTHTQHADITSTVLAGSSWVEVLAIGDLFLAHAPATSLSYSIGGMSGTIGETHVDAFTQLCWGWSTTVRGRDIAGELCIRAPYAHLLPMLNAIGGVEAARVLNAR